MEHKAPELIKRWLADDGRMASWLAAKTGATRPMVSGWLNGQAIPIAMYREKLAGLTGLPVAEMEAWR